MSADISTEPAPVAVAKTAAGAAGARPLRPPHRFGRWHVLGIVILVMLVPASIAVGSATIPLDVVWKAVSAYDGHDQSHVIVRDIRVPRTAVAIVVGAALGAAGTLMQTVTRNPLAEPGLLGVNSGAALVVAAGLMFAPGASSGSMMLFAFLGAALAGLAALLLGGAFRQSVDPVRLVLAGVAISVVLGALTSVIVLNNAAVFSSFRFYDAGAIIDREWSLIGLATLALALTTALCLVFARSLDSVALGPEFARAQGASPARTWTVASLGIVVLAGSATALAGPISFIGLAAPLLARRIVGPSVQRLLPLSMLFAADLLLAADLLGRTLMHPREVQAAIVCALVGAPLFIVIVRRGTVRL